MEERIKTMLPLLNEKQRRIFLAAEAISYGWGEISKVGVFQIRFCIVDKSRIAVCQRMLDLYGFWGSFETYVC